MSKALSPGLPLHLALAHFGAGLEPAHHGGLEPQSLAERATRAHAHRDFPERDDDKWMRHSLWYSEGNRLDYKPVNLKPMTVETFQPKKRTF